MIKVVLSGVETNNKGAEIMLYAILQEVERQHPDAIVYVANVPQGVDYIKSNLKIIQKPVWRIRRFFEKIHIWNILVKIRIDWLFSDIYSVGKIDFLFDGSGFCVSDKWNTSNRQVKNWDRLLSISKRDGAKIVFLPQGFGPIERNNNKLLMSIFDKYGDLIIAREKVSYDYIRKSGLANMSKVRIYTDFTSLVKGVVPLGFEHLRNAVCVIPNVRMIDMGTISLDDYITLLSKIIIRVKSSGHMVYLLNHEGAGDEKLAYQCRHALKEDIEVVTGLNGLEVKGLISTAKLVITSRFHGVASALNSCVPCLSTSWSHKYSELYKDYGLEDGVLPINDDVKSLKLVEDYLSDDKNSSIRHQLERVLPHIQDETKRMWNEIWNI